MRQLQALDILLRGKSAFLTGAPGSGKTYVLNDFIRMATKLGKNVAVTASTGIAATHIGGTTIHSWSGLGIRETLSEYDKDRLRSNDRLIRRYNANDVLVIDEVSMLHGRRLDMISEACKLLREDASPFGGLQVVLVGDMFQLPPITRGREAIDFVHTSRAWQELDPVVCYLTEQHRQEHDGLLDLLEAMRRGDINELHEALLQDRLSKKHDGESAITRLYSHNVDVEGINQRHLRDLNEDVHVYDMQVSGSHAKAELLIKSVLAPQKLELKRGAEVMFVANNFGAGFVNGTRGRVVDFVNGEPIVELLNGREIKVERHSWSLEEDGKKRAEVAQYPLRLAWAITIHKSQGMSLDAAEIDLSRSFTPGMGYVALSRVRSIEGVFLAGINNVALAMHPDIFTFDTELRQRSESLASITPDYLPVADEADVIDEELCAKLKDWRMLRAAADNIPAYIIAHNTVLEALAARPPQTMQSFKGIKGFGPKKTETYGPEILDIVTQHLAGKNKR